MTVLGYPREIEFFGFFVGALRSVRPDFTGPPMDPPPLPFQLQDPGRLHQELANAGLKDVCVETITEELPFRSGTELRDWLVNSNPIAGMVLEELDLTKAQIAVVREALDRMVADRAGGDGATVLTNPINIGIATQ